RDITDVVIEQSTREEIEESVCERLAASDSYEFAWFAEVDPRTQSIEPKVEVGVDGYLEEVDISVSPDEPIGRGPTGRAVQTGTIQVSQNVSEDANFEPWRGIPEKFGYRSSAAIPVTHEDTMYGVIGVYTTRQPAFTGDERGLIGQIGEVVGHAIAAIERKRALMSDEVVELEFQIRDVLERFGLTADVDGTVELEDAVPIGDDTFLQYGTATDDALSVVEELVASDRLPHWESITVLETGNGVAHFELRLTEPPILSTIVAHGGDIRAARMEDDNYYMRIHLAPGGDVRQVVEAIKEAYPAMEMITQRQVEKKRQSSPTLRDAFFEDLTDRQRAALESAYYAGFYEWPRTTTGEEVAASLGVSPSTFHQHLRKGQRKLLTAVLEDGASA
ncbi:MAG: bacterio-opsin activator domain-containing protein, partial [Halodesulfurarchaeum sp.]